MPRAWQTAEAIARHTGLEPLSTELLRERNFGDLRGRPYDSLSFNPLEMLEAPANGESLAEFHERVTEAFEYAVRMRVTLDGPLIVVCHGLVIHAMLAHCIDLGKYLIPARIGNTSITQVIAQHPFTAELVNCTTHLDGTDLAEDTKSLSGG
jgi:broad specificity phosphatase PhoE